MGLHGEMMDPFYGYNRPLLVDSFPVIETVEE